MLRFVAVLAIALIATAPVASVAEPVVSASPSADTSASPEPSSAPTPIPERTPYPYPASASTAFQRGCAGEFPGADGRAACRCMWAKIRQTYTYQEFHRIAIAMEKKKTAMPEQIRAIGTACVTGAPETGR